MRNKKYQDLNAAKSDKKGFAALIENTFRKFRDLPFVFIILFLIFLFVISVGLSLFPGFWIFDWITRQTENMSTVFQIFWKAQAFAFGYVLYCLSIIFIVPLVNFLIPFKIKAYHGPWIALETIPWYIHNALTYFVRYTALKLITPTPLTTLFYKMMGMKVGKGVLINTTNISDPCLIELGDNVVIGGSASLMAHYGIKGRLVIDRVVIGKNTNIGLNANLLGGIKVGKNVTIAPNTTVLPNTEIEDNTKFGI